MNDISLNRFFTRTKKEPTPQKNSISRPELYQLAVLPTQKFTVYPFERKAIVGNKGTRIYIEPNTFTYMNGIPVSEPVELEFKEIYTRSEMVRENLKTTSGNAYLDSAGMIYMNATSYDENVIIQRGHPIRLEFPTAIKKKLEGKQVYVGHRLKKESIEWKLKKSMAIWKGERPKNLQTPGAIFNLLNRQRKISGKMVENFFCEVTTLGWMNFASEILKNCQPTKLTIREKTNAQIDIMVALKATGTVLPLNSIGKNTFTAPDIPIGEKVYITGFGQIENDLYFAIKETTITPDHNDILDFQLMPAKNIFKKLKGID